MTSRIFSPLATTSANPTTSVTSYASPNPSASSPPSDIGHHTTTPIKTPTRNQQPNISSVHGGNGGDGGSGGLSDKRSYSTNDVLSPSTHQVKMNSITNTTLQTILSSSSSSSSANPSHYHQTSSIHSNPTTVVNAIWKRADDRFFWNKNVLDDLIKVKN